MATIEQILTRVQQRLRQASGINVQIHAEDNQLGLIRENYNMLFDDHWWDDHTLFATYTLNGSTGEVTADLSSVIRRYIDIHSVYYDVDPHALPRLQVTTNPSLVRTRCIAPSASASRVFKVMPVDSTGDVHVIYRTRIADSVWEQQVLDTEVNLDDELLINAVCRDYIIDEGSNPDAADKFAAKVAQRLMQLQKAAFQGGISKRPQELTSGAEKWVVDY